MRLFSISRDSLLKPVAKQMTVGESGELIMVGFQLKAMLTLNR